VYARALNRAPTVEELKLSLEILGNRPEPAAVSDFLWMVIAVPEFQVID
jgi:hypothetical protein